MQINDIIITAFSYIKNNRKRNLILKCFQFKNKEGIEIGGPSSMFSLRGHFPIYLFAKSFDGVNFNNETIWEGQISEGLNYPFHKKGLSIYTRGNKSLWH